MKVYVVTYIDSGETCDGKPRCAGVYKTRQKAEAYVKSDIESYEDMGYEVDYDNMSCEEAQCEWNIEAVNFNEN